MAHELLNVTKPHELLNKIYRILVEQAGATDTLNEQWRFTTYVLKSLESWNRAEYCFEGLLEYGGKIYITDKNKWYVSCYPESLNAQRQVIMMFTNNALTMLKQTVTEAQV